MLINALWRDILEHCQSIVEDFAMLIFFLFNKKVFLILFLKIFINLFVINKGQTIVEFEILLHALFPRSQYTAFKKAVFVLSYSCNKICELIVNSIEIKLEISWYWTRYVLSTRCWEIVLLIEQFRDMLVDLFYIDKERIRKVLCSTFGTAVQWTPYNHLFTDTIWRK